MAGANKAAPSPAISDVLQFKQVSSILNQIVKQATGADSPVAVDTSTFVTQADTAMRLLSNGLIPAISGVITRSIFTERPYASSFKGLMIEEKRWGAITRKFSPYMSKSFDNEEYKIKDGDLAGTWPIIVPKVLQTVFIGAATAMRGLTFFKNQLDTGFAGPEDFARFVAMYVAEFHNTQEQEFEALGRFTVNNLIAAVVQTGQPEQQIHLLTEYNTEMGTNLTPTSVMHPDNYVPFVLWTTARINTLFDFMKTRGEMFHVSPDIGNDLKIPRSTPRNLSRMYTLSKWSRQVQNQALPTLFNSSALQLVDSEVLPFWQSPKQPDQIIITPSTIDAQGHTVTGATQTINNIFGVIMDVDAAGIGLVNQWSAPTQFDAVRGVWGDFYHFTKQYYNDLTENVVVLLMD